MTRDGLRFEYVAKSGAQRAVTITVPGVREVVKEGWAEYLGNTPAVCRASYVDPRIIDLFSEGVTLAPTLRRLGSAGVLVDPGSRGRVERAVLRLLAPRR